jgi:Leucine-rich repeat (LRR) protein
VNCLVFPQQVALTLKTDQGDQLQYVDADVTELSFVKNGITGIGGLSQLKHLESIAIGMNPFIEDFSFLKDAPGLKTVIIGENYTYTDLSFVKYLPNLEILFVSTTREKEIKLDLVNNKHLEYIAFRHGKLESIPELLNIPDTLRYLNLEGNNIKRLPVYFCKYKNIRIFMDINPYEDEMHDNLIFERAGGILEKKYPSF